MIAICDISVLTRCPGTRPRSAAPGGTSGRGPLFLRGMIEGRFAELIAGQRQGVLVTLRKDGWPQLSNVNYAWYPEEQTIRISTTDDRAKTSNMRRDPRVSFHVTSGDFWSYVVVDGQRRAVGGGPRPARRGRGGTGRAVPRGAGRPSRLGRLPGGHGPRPAPGRPAAGRAGLRNGSPRLTKRKGRLRRAKPGFRLVDGRRNEYQ